MPEGAWPATSRLASAYLLPAALRPFQAYAAAFGYTVTDFDQAMAREQFRARFPGVVDAIEATLVEPAAIAALQDWVEAGADLYFAGWCTPMYNLVLLCGGFPWMKIIEKRRTACTRREVREERMPEALRFLAPAAREFGVPYMIEGDEILERLTPAQNQRLREAHRQFLAFGGFDATSPHVRSDMNGSCLYALDGLCMIFDGMDDEPDDTEDFADALTAFDDDAPESGADTDDGDEGSGGDAADAPDGSAAQDDLLRGPAIDDATLRVPERAFAQLVHDARAGDAAAVRALRNWGVETAEEARAVMAALLRYPGMDAAELAEPDSYNVLRASRLFAAFACDAHAEWVRAIFLRGWSNITGREAAEIAEQLRDVCRV